MWQHLRLPSPRPSDKPVCFPKGRKYAYTYHNCSEIRLLASCRSSSWNQWLVLSHTELQLGPLYEAHLATRAYAWGCLLVAEPLVRDLGSMVRMKMVQLRRC